MRKFFRCFGFVFLFCLMLCNGRVRAYDVEKVKLDDDTISFFSLKDNVYIRISSRAIDNNPYIYYQLISISNDFSSEIEKKMEEVNDEFDICNDNALNEFNYKKLEEKLNVQGKSCYDDEECSEMRDKYQEKKNACWDVYDPKVEKIKSEYPGYDEKNWIKIDMPTDDDEYKLTLPSATKGYVLWVKAKDMNNEDAYNVHFLESLENDVVDNSKEEVKPEDSKEEIKDNSKEEAKPEDSKDEVKDESKEETKVENNKENKEETKKEEVKNPETGVYCVYGFGLLCIVLLIVLKKKSLFSKI